MDNQHNTSELTEDPEVIWETNSIMQQKQQEIRTILNGQLVDGIMFVIETSSYPLQVSIYTEAEKIGYLKIHSTIECIIWETELIRIPAQNPHQESRQNYLKDNPDFDDQNDNFLLRRSFIENNIECCRVMRLSTMSKAECAFESDMEKVWVIQAAAHLINSHLKSK